MSPEDGPVAIFKALMQQPNAKLGDPYYWEASRGEVYPIMIDGEEIGFIQKKWALEAMFGDDT